jgi:uncharacterized protein YbjT (DUF2867 family)
MKILLIGGTGRIGRPLIDKLLDRGIQQIRVLSKSSERAATLPEAVETFISDVVADPEATRAAFSGIDTVFMVNSPTVQETTEGLLCVALARDSQVKRFVYQSVHKLEDLMFLPHVGSKLSIQRAVEQSGMDFTLICPNCFFQNDDLGRKPLLESNLYIQPIGNVGCSSVDIGDISDAAEIVLTSDGHSGKSYNLVGPDIVTSADCAAIWSHALGRTIDYVQDIGIWKEIVKPFMPAWKVYDLGLMYEKFSRIGMLGTEADVDRVTGLLGRPPKSYEEYVNDRIAEWS